MPPESGYSTQAMDTHQELGKEGCLPILPISTPTLTYIAYTRRVINTCFLFAGGSTAPTIAQDFPDSSSTQSLASGSPGLRTTCTLTRSTSTPANRCSEESITQGIEPNISSIVYWKRRILLQRCASSSARQPSTVSNRDGVFALDCVPGEGTRSSKII